MSDEGKRRAAEAALAELPPSGVIGLGTGSTARFVIEGVGALVAAGRKFVCVATSKSTVAAAKALGIPLLDEDGPFAPDVTIDGADEVDPRLFLVKGGGAAHTREKIVNLASRRNIIVATEDKWSAAIGTLRHVPVEVVKFGHRQTALSLAKFGVPHLRLAPNGQIVETDGGNVIYDLETGPLRTPETLDQALHAVAGVVETGLFLHRADVIYLAGPEGVRRVESSAP